MLYLVAKKGKCFFCVSVHDGAGHSGLRHGLGGRKVADVADAAARAESAEVRGNDGSSREEQRPNGRHAARSQGAFEGGR